MKIDSCDIKNNWSDFTNKLMLNAAHKKQPLVGTFELTARCNLHCKMCYIRRDETEYITNNEISADDWIRLGEQAFNEGTLFLLLTGGEPILRKDFRKIYEALNKMGFIITIYTNATLIDEDFVNWIIKFPPSKIGITLYGGSSESYEAVTGSKLAFDKTIKGIDLLIKNNINIKLRATITKYSKDEKIKIIDIANIRNLNVHFGTSLVKPIRGAVSNVENVRLTSLEELEFDNIYTNAINEKNENQYILPVKEKNEIHNSINCFAGKCSYWITWDGKMLPCAMMETPYSEPFKLNLSSSWNEIVDKTNKISFPSDCLKCKYKKYCSVCPGMIQAETGSFDKLNPYICERAKLLYNLYNKVE